MQEETGRILQAGSRPSADERAKMSGTGQGAAVAEIHLGLFQQMETINRLWIERLQQAKASEADLWARLMECSDPGRVTFLWNSWLLEQATEQVRRNNRLAKMWLDFYTGATGFKVSPGAGDSASTESTAGR